MQPANSSSKKQTKHQTQSVNLSARSLTARARTALRSTPATHPTAGCRSAAARWRAAPLQSRHLPARWRTPGCPAPGAPQRHASGRRGTPDVARASAPVASYRLPSVARCFASGCPASPPAPPRLLGLHGEDVALARVVGIHVPRRAVHLPVAGLGAAAHAAPAQRGRQQRRQNGGHWSREKACITAVCYPYNTRRTVHTHARLRDTPEELR